MSIVHKRHCVCAAACAIATDILQLVGLKSFRVAGVMLVGLLLYDVFWVFGSPSAIGDNVSALAWGVGTLQLLQPEA